MKNLLAWGLLAGVGLVACEQSPGDALRAASSQGRSSAFPSRLEAALGEIRLGKSPRRILPANAAWIDYVSLLVSSERVVALPGEAFGYSRLGEAPGGWEALPNLPVFDAERVLAFSPDLVLAHTWQSPETITTLRNAGVAVLVVPVPESWPEVLQTLALLGAALDERERARTLEAELEARRLHLAQRAARFSRLRAVSYTNLGAGGWAAGAGTTGDVLLLLAGLRNATAEAGLVGDVPADQERLLALAPDLFLVGLQDRSESGPPSATFLLGNPALASIPAIRTGHVLSLPAALFTSASPELLSGAERLVHELERLAEEPPGTSH